MNKAACEELKFAREKSVSQITKILNKMPYTVRKSKFLEGNVVFSFVRVLLFVAYLLETVLLCLSGSCLRFLTPHLPTSMELFCVDAESSLFVLSHPGHARISLSVSC